MYLNKAQIIGNLTRDPEMKSLTNGNKVTSFSVATNRVYKDSNGDKKEESEFHNVTVFGKQAETSSQYLKKGQQVYIEGRITTRSWDDKTTGEKKYRTEIVADTVQFGPKVGSTAQESNTPTSYNDTPVEGKGIDMSEFTGEVDESRIPF